MEHAFSQLLAVSSDVCPGPIRFVESLEKKKSARKGINQGYRVVWNSNLLFAYEQLVYDPDNGWENGCKTSSQDCIRTDRQRWSLLKESMVSQENATAFRSL